MEKSSKKHEPAGTSAASSGTKNKDTLTSTQKMTLPFFGIQADWDESLCKTLGGTSWVTVRRPEDGDGSIHGTLKCTSQSPWNVTCSEPFELIKSKSVQGRYMSIKDDQGSYECSFVAPVTTYNEIHKKGIISMDVSEGGLGVSVCKNNQLKIWESETGVVRRTLEGHIIDVYSCKFFPSGIVILSGGADMMIKIWSAETGECPVTLKGHTQPIQDTCIVERGRNIISVSKDGTSKLWDCGEEKCLATLSRCDSEINSCALVSPGIDLGLPVSDMSEREVGTTGKLLLVAREDSKIQGIGVSSRTEVFNSPLPSPGNRVISVGPNTFVVGCQGGEIATFDLRKIVPPKHITCTAKTPILDLMSHPRSPFLKPNTDESKRLFWAAKGDGTICLVNPSLDDQQQGRFVQLTGSDYDPIYQIKHDGNFIYSACRDGCIRKYSISHVTKCTSND